MPVQKECIVCGASFSVPPVRANTAMCCGRACKAQYARAKYQEARPKVECQQCGKRFTLPKSHFERGNGKFCSSECRHLSMKGISFRPPAVEGVVIRGPQGYLLERASEHPYAVNGYVMQHRLRVEERMRVEAPEHPFLQIIEGERYLRRGLEVHHLDRSRTNNQLDNLVVCTATAHRQFHTDAIPAAELYWPRLPGAPVEGTFVLKASMMVEAPCKVCGRLMTISQANVWRGRAVCSKACKLALKMI